MVHSHSRHSAHDQVRQPRAAGIDGLGPDAAAHFAVVLGSRPTRTVPPPSRGCRQPPRHASPAGAPSGTRLFIHRHRRIVDPFGARRKHSLPSAHLLICSSAICYLPRPLLRHSAWSAGTRALVRNSLSFGVNDINLNLRQSASICGSPASPATQGRAAPFGRSRMRPGCPPGHPGSCDRGHQFAVASRHPATFRITRLDGVARTDTLEVTRTEPRVVPVPQSSPHRTRAIAALCDDLNATKTLFPGSTLRLRYAIRRVP